VPAFSSCPVGTDEAIAHGNGRDGAAGLGWLAAGGGPAREDDFGEAV